MAVVTPISPIRPLINDSAGMDGPLPQVVGCCLNLDRSTILYQWAFIPSLVAHLTLDIKQRTWRDSCRDRMLPFAENENYKMWQYATIDNIKLTDWSQCHKRRGKWSIQAIQSILVRLWLSKTPNEWRCRSSSLLFDLHLGEQNANQIVDPLHSVLGE